MPLEPVPSESIALIPALIFARIATVALVGGRLSGARADVVYGAELSIPSAGLHPIGLDITTARSTSWSSTLCSVFDLALSRHMRTTHPQAFPLHMQKVHKGLPERAMEISGRRALPIFLCANPDERVWALSSRDERHWSFPTPAAARFALEQALGAGINALSTQGPALGLRLLAGPPLHIESESRFDCAPCLPSLPLTSINKGHVGQANQLWAPLCNQLACAIEADQLACSTPAAPERARLAL